VLAILNRFPSVVMLGGALIGWIAGSMMVTDVTIVHLFPNAPAALPLMGGHRRRPGAAGRAAQKPQALQRIAGVPLAPSIPTASSLRQIFPHPPSFALRLVKTPDPGICNHNIKQMR
jgi:hypothetical protein